MSPTLTAILTALGGLIAGLSCGAVALHWQHERLLAARRDTAAALRRADNAEYQALHDDTTGIANRRAFLTVLQQALADGDPTGVVLLDLDNFKTVNDTYGHGHGNEVLTTVGLRLADLGAPVALAARLSGDEFALLVNGTDEQTRACARAAARAVSGQPIAIAAAVEITVHASAGYALATADTSVRDLLNQADLAMYRAKRAKGGAGGITSTPSPHTRYRDARHPYDPAARD